MQASRFLAMSKSEFYIVVMNGFAVHFELDGSIALFETSSLPDGVYDVDYNPADEEIIKFYDSILDQPAGTNNTTSVRKMTLAILKYMESVSEENMSKISDVPKFTKAISEGLTKINELATFKVDDDIKFVCFGTRSEVTDYLESLNITTFSCSPLNLYYASNFKGDLYGVVVSDANMIIVYNQEKTCGGIVFSIDIHKFEHYKYTNA